MSIETNVVQNNKVFLIGTVESHPKYSHELYGEGFFEFMLTVPRLSGQSDILPITVSERLLSDHPIEVGTLIAFNGQFRSYNKLINNHSKLMLTVFIRDFVEVDENDANNPNIVELSGYICKPPVYRTTPFNREICDLLIAVNRAYNKSDYIPCIAWGRNARYVRSVTVGQKITVVGRIQSRVYNKKLDEEQVETRTAYEMSINKIMLDNSASTGFGMNDDERSESGYDKQSFYKEEGGEQFFFKQENSEQSIYKVANEQSTYKKENSEQSIYREENNEQSIYREESNEEQEA